MLARIALPLLAVAACGGGDERVPVDAAPCLDPTHDEDGDGIGDRCDVCPATPDPLQRDTTEVARRQFEDGVGDACDPRPALGGDTLEVLHAFATAAGADAWTGTGWTIGDDRAVAAGDARWTARAAEQGDGLFVQARIPVLAWQGAGAVELILDGDGGTAGLICRVTRDRDGDGADELEAREPNAATEVASLGARIAEGELVLTAWRVIDLNFQGRLTCRATYAGTTHEAQIATVDGGSTGSYVIATTAAAVDVSSIVVYTSPVLGVKP